MAQGRMLNDFICPVCFSRGTMYGTATEEWNFEEQNWQLSDADVPEITWNCVNCGEIWVMEYRLPERVWETLSALTSASDIMDIIMGKYIKEEEPHSESRETLLKHMIICYNAAAVHEKLPASEIEANIEAAKVFHDL